MFIFKPLRQFIARLRKGSHDIPDHLLPGYEPDVGLGHYDYWNVIPMYISIITLKNYNEYMPLLETCSKQLEKGLVKNPNWFIGTISLKNRNRKN